MTNKKPKVEVISLECAVAELSDEQTRAVRDRFAKAAMTKLLASSPLADGPDGIRKLIEEHLYGTKVQLHTTDGRLFTVSNSKGPCEGFRVVKKGSRYRFELIMEKTND